MIIQGDFEGNDLEPVIGTGAQSHATAAEAAAPSAGGFSPAEVRELLSGISKPPAPDPEVGAVHLASADRVLPGVIARAANSGTPFSLVVARPGPAASPGHPAGVPPEGQVPDLAAALSVSLGPSQELLQAGPHHVAVVIPGNTAPGRRQAVQLMQRAAGAGAPLFTWAAARYPRDATTADRLAEVGRRRVDGIELAHDRPAPALAAGESRWRTGGIWAAVAAAALIGALFFGLHGSGAPRSGGGSTGGQSGSGTTTSASGNAGNGSVGGSATLSSGAGSTFPGSAGAGLSGSPGNTPGSGGSTGTGTSAGSAGGSSAGTSTGAQSTGSGAGQQSTTQSGSGSGTGGSTTAGGGSSGSGGTTGTGTGTTGSGGGSGSGSGSGSGLTTGLGNTVGTVLGTGSGLTGTGSTGSGSTATTGTSGTGTTATGSTGSGSSTNQCSGLLNTLTCTVNGLLGGGN